TIWARSAAHDRGRPGQRRQGERRQRPPRDYRVHTPLAMVVMVAAALVVHAAACGVDDTVVGIAPASFFSLFVFSSAARRCWRREGQASPVAGGGGEKRSPAA
ncbi:unnamed protein product, partial [Ectocarpus sp. 12 AP-2014]